MKLAENVYNITDSFPKSEMFGLTNQMRRCSVSIPSNVAEGYGRYSKVEFQRYLKIALGSAYELKTQILLAEKINYLRSALSTDMNIQINILVKMIHSLIRAL